MEITKNKKARFNYEILEEVEAGISLAGSEVKSLREKKVNIQEAYALFKKNELFLTNARIEPYFNASIFNHEPTRPRKLLLHRKEIDKLQGKLQQKGWVIVPLKMYFKKSHVKVLLGICRSKKNYDKRQTIKERDISREMQREMKNYK